MYFFGRGISAFFNQLFKWLFWNKKGNKVLFTILFFIIAICFIKLGEVSAVEEVSDINYEVRSYYDGLVSDAILRIEGEWDNLNDTTKSRILNPDYSFYFYYGNVDGSSYQNARPLSSNSLNVVFFGKAFNVGQYSPNNFDYLGITTYSMVDVPNRSGYIFRESGVTSFSGQTVSIPLFIGTYNNINWVTYVNAKRSGDTETIIALLEDINESLTNTSPDQETEDSVVVDSSAVDSISTASVDNVFSSLFTTLGNKFNNYDLSVTESWVWNLMGTRITFYSDTIYNVIKGTFMETLITSLWLYITGHYAFAWLSKLIHSIKDGSILNGIEMNEVLTKEIL